MQNGAHPVASDVAAWQTQNDTAFDFEYWLFQDEQRLAHYFVGFDGVLDIAYLSCRRGMCRSIMQ
jgi:hypothetical protein